MGLYDEDWRPALPLPRTPAGQRKLLRAAAAVLAVAALAGLAWWASEQLKPQPLTLSLDKDRLVADGSTRELVRLTVTVRNTTGKTAHNVPVTVEAVAGEVLLVGTESSQTRVVPTLEDGAERRLAFLVRPRPTRVLLPGSYVLVARATLNGEVFEAKTVLRVVQKA